MQIILVVEDDEDFRSLICGILRQADFYVFEAKNGFEGLLLTKMLYFDLVICNINMPKINGFEFLAALRQELSTRTIPVIMLTADSSYQYQKSAFELGANGYLIKPITAATLTTTVAQLLDQKMVS
jgi:CheY-like chemotaxis protein